MLTVRENLLCHPLHLSPLTLFLASVQVHLSVRVEINGPSHEAGLMNGPSRDPFGSLKLMLNHPAILDGVFQCIKSPTPHQLSMYPWEIVHDFLTLVAFYLLGVSMEILVTTVIACHDLHTDGFSVMVVEFNQLLGHATSLTCKIFISQTHY
jgi:hypothetical protein